MAVPLTGAVAVRYFINQYRSDISHVTGSNNRLNLAVYEHPQSSRVTHLELDRVFLPEIAGDEKTGVVFSVQENNNVANSMVAEVRPGTDLELLLKSQAINPFVSKVPLVPIYDLRTLVTHDDGLYGVNFCWVASMFPVVSFNEYGFTAGQRLFDALEALIGFEEVDAVLAVGERANAYGGVAFDRLGIPFTCSRPEGGKIKKDVIKIHSVSSYELEAGAKKGEGKVEDKVHYVDGSFMRSLKGTRVGILDDLDATRNTLGSFGSAVKAYGGEPIGFTVDHLAYVSPDILVKLGFPVKSVFVEYEHGKPTFTKELKVAMSAYSPRQI